ncbi:hypothetical protein CSKR_201665 [Clonorchis sinensis]|uniref:Saposin B-type domain-containing protein n=1 Tax=Clonorchis sinensis TaxID=79923 RepID=A0A8T1MTL3_CLOSI|nr:hypothetical protein CSKR_201665 [Clonorchis sinensis]
MKLAVIFCVIVAVASATSVKPVENDLCDECKSLVQTIQFVAKSAEVQQLLLKCLISVCDYFGLLKYWCISEGEKVLNKLDVYLESLDPEGFCKSIHACP